MLKIEDVKSWKSPQLFKKIKKGFKERSIIV